MCDLPVDVGGTYLTTCILSF